MARGRVTEAGPRCPHLSTIRERSKKRILAQVLKHPACNACGVMKDLWACLSCGAFGCGNEHDAHAQTHNGESEHPLVMCIATGMCYCYGCDQFVGLESRTSDMQLFHRTITDMCSGGLTQRTRRTSARCERQSEQVNGGFLGQCIPKMMTPATYGIHALGSKRKRDLFSRSDPLLESSMAVARSKRQKMSAREPGQVGLRNLGNTCFMNAVLQALSNTALFREYFLKLAESSAMDNVMMLEAQEKECRRCLGSVEISVSLEMKKVLHKLWNENEQSHAVSPESLRSILSLLLPRYSGRQQQDSHEFLRHLLDRLHVELTVGRGTRDAHTHSDSIVLETFQGRLVDEVSCTGCAEVSRRYDPFLDLSLDIPQQNVGGIADEAEEDENVHSSTLNECLERFTAWEDLHASEQRSCVGCGDNKRAKKRLLIEAPPRVLCLHLKRFEWLPPKPRCKISTEVRFPSVLDVGRYTTRAKSCEYSLFGLITHHGTTTRSGHYTACCLNEGKWFQYDDSKVKPLTPEAVLDLEAYMLFYRRRDT